MKPENPDQKAGISQRGAAVIIGIPESTLRSWIDSGKITKPAIYTMQWALDTKARLEQESVKRVKPALAINFDSWALKRFGSDRRSTIQHYWPEIENAAQSIGASVNGVNFIFDADFHKLASVDNKHGKHSYTAIIRQDGFPVITFQRIGKDDVRVSCRDLAYQEWKRLKDQGLLDSESISEAEAAAWRRDTETITAENKASAEQQAKAREQEKRDKQTAAAKAAAREYSNARFLSLFGNEQPYLERKGITGTEAEAAGVKVSADGERLIIPIFDALTGEIITIQRIDRNGNKALLSGGRKQGGLLRIGGKGKAWLCEGVATGFSVHQITGQPVIVCFDASNIKTIAGLIDHADLLGVAADNDKSQAGEEAAKATGLAYRLPLFRSTKDKTKDWNDAAIDNGKAMAMQQWAAYESQKPVFTVESLWALLSPTSLPLLIRENIASGTITNAEQEEDKQALTWYSVDQKALLEVVAWSELKEAAVSDVQLKIQKRKAVEASIESFAANALPVSVPVQDGKGKQTPFPVWQNPVLEYGGGYRLDMM